MLCGFLWFVSQPFLIITFDRIWYPNLLVILRYSGINWDWWEIEKNAENKKPVIHDCCMSRYPIPLALIILSVGSASSTRFIRDINTYKEFILYIVSLPQNSIKSIWLSTNSPCASINNWRMDDSRNDSFRFMTLPFEAWNSNSCFWLFSSNAQYVVHS